jgi:hypothetical protein
LSKQIASKYLLFMEAKQGLALHLLQQFQAEDKFRSVVEEI